MRVELLHDDDPRPILFHHFNYTIVQCLKSRSHIDFDAAFRAANHAGFADVGCLGPYFQDGVPRGLQAGIDAQDAQSRRKGRQDGRRRRRRFAHGYKRNVRIFGDKADNCCSAIGAPLTPPLSRCYYLQRGPNS
jgi:hypothetical protein